MSLKLRLNLLITALLLLVMLVGTTLLLHNARDQIRAEIESISTLATHLLDAESLYFSRVAQGWPGHPRLQGLEHLRHLRIEIYDSAHRLLYSNHKKDVQVRQRGAPGWFIGLMTAQLDEVMVRRSDIYANQKIVGEVVITADPSNEIDEVWNDTVDLFGLVTVFFVAVNLMVYWAVGHALRPVNRILVALNELERGNLNARLPEFRLRELSSISEKFNHMAQTLQQSITRNHKLSQQLIYLQEEERKSLARELHDELGQCLTAILADGTTLLKMSETKFPAARASAQAVVEVTRQLMGLTRAMLQRLRPEALDGLGLRAALEDLIAGWRQRYPGHSCIVSLGGDFGQLPDTVGITAYRIVQECLTNTARHADARRVTVDVRKIRTPAGEEALEITVEDDGKGFDPLHLEGFGLIGMRERVEGLGGRFDISSAVGSGTRIFARLPIKRDGEV